MPTLHGSCGSDLLVTVSTPERIPNSDLYRMLRTDRNDNEGGEEWASNGIKEYKDPMGDDDIDVAISANGTLQVAYRHEDPRSLRECDAC